MKNLVSVICGLIFGAGLAASGMTDTEKVIGFLNVFGVWDPSLMLVMASALAFTLITFRFVLKTKKPLFDKSFHLPTTSKITNPLVVGAVLFGIGWGLVGYCPGPAIAALAYFKSDTVIFVISMLVGGFMAQLFLNRKV